MTSPGRITLGTGLALVAAMLTAALSRIPYTPDPDTGAVLRLSWRAWGERLETCRDLTDREQENLPVHMRQQRICEGVTARYRLRVAVDGMVLADRIVAGSGARQRRPLYVMEEFPLDPGRHEVQIGFDRETAVPEPGGGDRDAGHAVSVPPSLRLEQPVSLSPRQVVLVTYDPEERRLVELTGPAR